MLLLLVDGLGVYFYKIIPSWWVDYGREFIRGINTTTKLHVTFPGFSGRSEDGKGGESGGDSPGSKSGSCSMRSPHASEIPVLCCVNFDRSVMLAAPTRIVWSLTKHGTRRLLVLGVSSIGVKTRMRAGETLGGFAKGWRFFLYTETSLRYEIVFTNKAWRN